MTMTKRRKGPHELVAFLAMHAVDYQKFYKLDGLHPIHYDLMKKYGARMDSFKRATNASCGEQSPRGEYEQKVDRDV